MKVESIELTFLDVPFTPHTEKHMKLWLPHWRILQICRLAMDNGIVGIGENMPGYWSRSPEDVEERIVGREAAGLMWDDSLGAGVQMALFDALGKNEGVPVHQLLGTQVRDWVPLSWWAMDMPAVDWARQCEDAVEAGYMSAKLKARSWLDMNASLEAIIHAVPPQFELDLDYNRTLDNAASAVEHIKNLERYPQVSLIETPISQADVAGNRHIRDSVNLPLVLHFGEPPISTCLKEDIADGFVLNGGADCVRSHDAIAHAANKPFFLQLVGSGITTTWAAHLGAVCRQAKWPAVTCMNVWEEQLIEPRIELRGGYHAVPDGPGLGIELDERLIRKLAVDYSWIDPPRHVYRYSRANGEATYFGCDKYGLHSEYIDRAMPICEPGSECVAIEDDESNEFEKLWQSVLGVATLRRREDGKDWKKS